jgi:hypothetical protein
MAGIEGIVAGAAEDRAKVKALQEGAGAEHKVKLALESEKRKSTATLIAGEILICKNKLDAAYEAAPSDMRSRIETVRDRCRTVLEEFGRIYGTKEE